MSTKHKEKTENNIECTAKATITDLKQDVRANTRNITISKRLIAFGKLFLLFAILIIVPLVLYLLYKDTLFNKAYLSNIQNKLDDFNILNAGFESEAFAVGARKADITLVNKINEAFHELYREGTFQKIANKWFGEDVATEEVKSK